MGKNNSNRGLQVIPLDSNMLNNHKNHLRSSLLALHSNVHKPFISDPSIIPRVQKYLEANVNKTYIDVNVMADDLQKKYKEYGRRKRNAFRGSVKKAYAIVMQSHGLSPNMQQNSSSEDVSEDSNEDDDSSYQESMLGAQFLEMYNRDMRPVATNELINISSDDESSDKVTTSKKLLAPANGPSTSHLRELSVIPQAPKNLDLNKLLKIKYQGKSSACSSDRGKKRKTEEVLVPPVLKKKKTFSNLVESTCTFNDIGGMSNVLKNLPHLIVHIKHPEVYREMGARPPRGILLHGPPGCGKTLLANAIAGQLQVPLIKVSAPELVAGISGESEERIRELFERAKQCLPCVIFFDEIDAITQNRQNAQKDMERRIVTQLINCFDDLNENALLDQILVIGATNRPDSLDPALRREGRFETEVCVGIPDTKARCQILQVLSANLKVDAAFNLETLALLTPGFVGADLKMLITRAVMVAIRRVMLQVNSKRSLVKIGQKPKKAKNLQVVKEPDSAANLPSTSAVDSDDSRLYIDVESTDMKGDDKDHCDSNTVVIIDDDAKDDKDKQTIEGQVDKEESSPPKSDMQSIMDEMSWWLGDEFPLTSNQLKEICITMDDFTDAMKEVQPSTKREGFATVPTTTWEDVGSLKDIREELQLAIVAPVKFPKQFQSIGMSAPSGVLLCGPPGCGKTLLAKAIANEAGINFLSVKGPELLNMVRINDIMWILDNTTIVKVQNFLSSALNVLSLMYVGESEREVRMCFKKARNSAPCVIFFDELDALCPKRLDSTGSDASARVVNQLLTEMDGIEGREGVYLLAASNRPDIIDPAVLRPGRLGKILYVDVPSASDRLEILKTITKNGTKPSLADDVDLEAIANFTECEGFTGADLDALVRTASVEALKEVILENDQEKHISVSSEHFKMALKKIRPSVSEKDRKRYERLKKLYSTKTSESD